MERAAILAIVIEEIRSSLCDPDTHITEDMTLNALGLDSLDVMETVFEIEERTGVTVNEGDVRLNTNVGEVADLFAAKKEKACRKTA